jgi:uncharacterized protein YbjT (DUF2867 family)
MRVLILGGNGFIGSEVCRVLASRGHAVTALAREPGAAARRMPGIAWLRGDLSTKREADFALAASGLPFVIIRPAIVIGRNAHGGSALLRALAAIPLWTPLVSAGATIQFAALADVASAVEDAIEGRIPVGSDIAIADARTLTLRQAVALHRAWLGLPPAKAIDVPSWLAAPVVAIADLLGHLGWRSPLRSTAIELAAGGGPTNADGSTNKSTAALAETLAANPAGVQDLWFARLYLLKPIVIGSLGLFWLASGAIALACFDQSSAILASALGADGPTQALTLITSLADILLGVGVLVRRFARPALIGMVLVSLAYLAAATILTPWLWADPLGPLVKVVPSIVLALVALAILDER